MEFTLKQIAELIEGEIVGEFNSTVNSLAKIEHAKANELSFLANAKYEEFIYTTKASAVIVSKGFEPKKEISSSLIKVEDPYLSFTQILEKYQELKTKVKVGIEDPSYVSASAQIGEDTYLGAFSYVGDDCFLDKNVKVYPNTYVGDNCRVGENTILYAGVKVYPNTSIGSNCIIHSGAVIGSDGFGFAPQSNGEYKAIPQIGQVIIEDNVSIGANTTVDRATMGATVIKKGVKLDNLIQIAHNVEVGENTVMASQVGISGSTKIGKNCQFGGQSALGGHIEIADSTTFGGKAASITSVTKSGQTLVGQPAQTKEDLMKDLVNIKRIPKIQNQLKELKEKILNLTKSLEK